MRVADVDGEKLEEAGAGTGVGLGEEFGNGDGG
jgi:hypothetical protein